MRFFSTPTRHVYVVPLMGSLAVDDLSPMIPGRNDYIRRIAVQAGVPPVGASLTFTLHLGTRSTGVLAAAFLTVTILTTAYIPAAGLVYDLTAPQFVGEDKFIQAKVTGIGSGTAGSDVITELF